LLEQGHAPVGVPLSFLVGRLPVEVDRAEAGTATNKLGQTFAEIAATLATELQKYDLALTQWKFSPIARGRTFS